MQCKVAYQVGQLPGNFRRLPTGMLYTSETGFRIDGPVPYSTDYTDINWLKISNIKDLTYEPGNFFIAVGSSPPVFIKPIVFGWLGFVWITKPRLNRTVHDELCQRLAGLDRCAEGGCYINLAKAPCPLCPARAKPKRRLPVRYVVGTALAALLFVYVTSYYHLSRRGMREAKIYSMPGFLYVPTEELFETRDLSRHYTLARLYAPLNALDQALFGAQGPIRGITWGLSK